MSETCLDYSSQELVEVPESVLKSTKVQKLFLNYNNLTRIPPLLCKHLTSLSCLSLNGNILEDLPEEIGWLSHLHELHVKENCLSKIPESISNLKKLQKLYLTGNQVVELPKSLSLLINLTELIADENVIESLPCNFGNLHSLIHLDLSCNAISSLPECFGKLKSLKVLNLSNNCLCSLPDTFQDLSKLEVIDLTNNQISVLPEKLKATKCMKKFLLTNNCLNVLPLWFSELENIKELYLGSNNLQRMPFNQKFCATCKTLEMLDLSGNNITDLPSNFGQLKSLKFLDIGSPLDEMERNRFLSNGNDLSFLPSSFCNLHNLTKLELDENELVELPANFGCLSNMTYLDLCHNAIRTLPESFCQLHKLKVCMLSMNNLSYLPDDFGMLTELQELRLDNNMLMELPESFQNLTALLVLDLYKNKLKIIPNSLHDMKCIKHMDLKENDFGLDFSKVPEVIRKSTYVERDPALQNTWRGRKREDIQPNSWVQSKVMENSKVLQSDVEINTLNSVSFLWRRHDQENARKECDVTSLVSRIENKMNCENFLSSNMCNGYCDEKPEPLSGSEDHPLSIEAGTSCSAVETESVIVNEDEEYLDDEIVEASEEADSVRMNQKEECWDDEILETIPSGPLDVSPYKLSRSNTAIHEATQFDDILSDISPDSSECSDWDIDYIFGFHRNFREIYKHPIEDADDCALKSFIPSDLHIPRIRKNEIWCPLEEGQFDDCDL